VPEKITPDGFLANASTADLTNGVNSRSALFATTPITLSLLLLNKGPPEFPELIPPMS
jgi:hypothetical protein